MFKDLQLDGACRLRLTVFYANGPLRFISPKSLSPFSGNPNQQFRIDLIDPSSRVDTLIGGSVLATIFQTSPGDPDRLEPTLITFDLTTWQGETVRLRLAEVDNQGALRAGVDDVFLDSAEG